MRAGWRRLSLRARLIVIGVLGVATALAIGSIALYGVLTLVSYRTLDQAGTATAEEVATLVDQGRLPDPIPVTGGQIVQVVDSRGRVVSASVNADRLTALLLPREVATALTGAPLEVPGSRVGLTSSLRVVAVRAGPRTVLVAQQTQDIRHSQQILKVTLLCTYPLLLAALALIAWRVVGATLRPVEALRSTAERISGTGQDARLPVPSSGDEIHALAVTLNSMLDRLAASRARQRSFVADAAHELRSPLASMQTQLDVAHRLGEGTPVTEDLRAEVLRMSRLVEDLLVLARLDADSRPTATPSPVPLRPLVLDVAGRFDGARVPVSTSGVRPAVVRGQPDELRRALSNLLDNAVRHAASAVEVTAYVDGPHVVLTVSDDGTGIPAAERERVFERFTRLDDARDRDAGGSGLGLAIVRELIRNNGGDIRLGRSAGGGLRVEVVLGGGAPVAEDLATTVR
jgi:signal transduction histidine kinase